MNIQVESKNWKWLELTQKKSAFRVIWEYERSEENKTQKNYSSIFHFLLLHSYSEQKKKHSISIHLPSAVGLCSDYTYTCIHILYAHFVALTNVAYMERKKLFHSRFSNVFKVAASTVDFRARQLPWAQKNTK